MRDLAWHPLVSSAIRCCHRRSWRVPRRSCATWRPSAATCCSEPVAITSTTSRTTPCNKREPGTAARTGRLQSHPRDSRRQRSLHRDASVGHVPSRWRRWRPSSTCHGHRRRAAHRDRRLPPAAGACAGTGQQSRAGRADHRRRTSRLGLSVHSHYLKIRDRACLRLRAGIGRRRTGAGNRTAPCATCASPWVAWPTSHGVRRRPSAV